MPHTGVRLARQADAGSLDHDATSVGRERVLAVERALAVEQRELRLFIQGLTPPVTVVPDGTTLASRLHDVRERVRPTLLHAAVRVGWRSAARRVPLP